MILILCTRYVNAPLSRNLHDALMIRTIVINIQVFVFLVMVESSYHLISSLGTCIMSSRVQAAFVFFRL